MTLRAVVIGAGWAGEGHTHALRHCGVEVVAICARQADVTQEVATRLGVPLASTDWRQTLATLKPEIVSLSTPAALRSEVIEMAAELGCHIFSEKPLATTAAEAKRLYQVAEAADIKHAYAATHLYDPHIAYVKELLQNGMIGKLREIELLVRQQTINALTPWLWMDTLANGGGVLNNALPHLLGMLEAILGARVVKVAGEARVLRRRAPVVPELHDFRQRGKATPTAAEAATLEWRACDVDNAFRALLQFAAPLPDTTPLPVSININFMADLPAPTNGWYIYGERGVLKMEGMVPVALLRYNSATGEYEPLPLPPRLVEALPQVGDLIQNKWAALASNFVADIRGEDHHSYLTFQDGWRYHEAIEAIRAGRGWYAVPE